MALFGLPQQFVTLSRFYKVLMDHTHNCVVAFLLKFSLQSVDKQQ